MTAFSLMVASLHKPYAEEVDDYVCRLATRFAQNLAYAVKKRKSLSPKRVLV